VAGLECGLELRLARSIDSADGQAPTTFYQVTGRRMRDSNSRGVATNTLSKRADLCPAKVIAVRDLRRWIHHALGGHR